MVAMFAAIGAMGSMAIHMVVPALPAVVRDLGADSSAVQLMVTVYLIGFGLGQLVAGPVADGVGRRVVLVTGMIVFTLGGVVVALADSIAVVIGARVLQAMGGAAGIVAVRAIVADMSRREDAASRVAMMTTVLLISPAVAPLAGGAIAALGGWRAIFWTLAGLGAAACLICWLLVAESLPLEKRGRMQAPWSGWLRLIRNPRFLRYAAALACASSAMYIFLSGSAFLLHDVYGLDTAAAGICYFLLGAAGIAGTFAVKTLERRGGAFRIGIASIVTGGVAMLACALLQLGGVVGLVGPMVLVGLGMGVSAPAGMAGVMHVEDGLSGTGASLAGTLQMVASGLTTSLIAQAHDVSQASLALGVLVAGVLAILIAPPGRAVVTA